MRIADLFLARHRNVNRAAGLPATAAETDVCYDGVYPQGGVLASNIGEVMIFMNLARRKDFLIRRSSIVKMRLVPAILLTGALMVSVSGAIRSLRAADAQRTTMDGVYTEEQATRGKAVYGQSCASCHMDDLSGSGQALPLAGDAFIETWEGQTVADLQDLVHNTMPQDKPGSLSPEASLDVISYLLQYNKFPAGKEELKNDPAALKNILITNKPAPPPAEQ